MEGRQGGRRTGLVCRTADTHSTWYLALAKVSLSSNEVFFKEISLSAPQGRPCPQHCCPPCIILTGSSWLRQATEEEVNSVLG